MVDAAIPRAAATLVVVRDTPLGLEVLLLRRADKGDHNSNAWVFPGGLVDAGDRACHPFCAGPGDAAASAALGIPDGGLDYVVAAVRECFEEAGLLFAADAQGDIVGLEGETGARLASLRGPLGRGEIAFADVCRNHGLRLATERIHYIAHWLTPIGLPKRFDTRFFLAVLPPGQASAHDAVETLEQVWLRPSVALAPENTRRLMTATRSTLEQIGAFADSAALLAWARSPRTVVRVMPRIAQGRKGPRPVLPHQPAWAEVSRLDPEFRGDAWSELRPNVAVPLSARVSRVSAEAPAGNSYVVTGRPEDGSAVVGPASLEETHLDALIAAAPGTIRWIFALDAAQATAAARLKARTDAAWIGRPGADFRPDTEAVAGASFPLGGDTTMRIVPLGATSGLLLVEEKTLFTPAGAPPFPQDASVEWVAPAEGFLEAASSPMEPT
jgi:8-oxo-dGTP pyrophosphatase MutT (NUDIX family)